MTDKRDLVERALVRNDEILAKLQDGKNSAELLATDYDPIPWIIPGFITPGMTLLCGSPKIGKSWLVMGMSCALAKGGYVFGEIKVEPCRVLLLALEDSERRLKDRLQKMWSSGSTLLDIRTRWPTGAEGIEWLDVWLGEFRETRVVFIDTLQRLTNIINPNDYAETYQSIVGLKAVADKHGVAIVAIHHTNKPPEKKPRADFVHSIMGSVGIVAAADTVIVMVRRRMQDDGILSITGRDVQEAERGIRFDPHVGSWTLLDEVPKMKSLSEEKKIKTVYRDGKMAATGELHFKDDEEEK
jgi:RecA-family ATPase